MFKSSKKKHQATFLGTFSFTKRWGDIPGSSIAQMIWEELPPRDTWTESPRDVKCCVLPDGIRLKPIDEFALETSGPIAWIPRMMAAVCKIEHLTSTNAKGKNRPCTAIMSYDALELEDGQVPKRDQEILFFITLLQFGSDKASAKFVTAAIQLWEPLKLARTKRLAMGLPDAVMAPPVKTTPAASADKHLPPAVQRVIAGDATSDDGGDSESLDSQECDTTNGYIDVGGFGFD